MLRTKVEGRWIHVTGAVSAKDLRALASFGDIEALRLELGDSPADKNDVSWRVLTAEHARMFSVVKSVRELELWVDVTRTAMRHVIAIPGLRRINVLHLRHPGHLESFRDASTLEELRCDSGLTEADLLEICSCQSLRKIGAQSSGLSLRVIDAFLGIPGLESLDLEATAFDDQMAARLSQAKQLRTLQIGATRITRVGLKSIANMKQLTEARSVGYLHHRSRSRPPRRYAESAVSVSRRLRGCPRFACRGFVAAATRHWFFAATLARRRRLERRTKGVPRFHLRAHGRMNACEDAQRQTKLGSSEQ